MIEVPHILSAIQDGDPHAAEQLLPLVYQELRRLAAQKLGQEKPGQTLDATALVHEAYLRLVDAGKERHWDGRRHFLAAAAEAMRRILVENARRKRRVRHGGGRHKVDLEDQHLAIEAAVDDLLALNEALDELADVDRGAAELVKLRYFAGMTTEQGAEVLGVPARTAYRSWSFARAWLYRRLHAGEEMSS
jgi:RNA polymerase sigma factor (TIGR02999 family)